MSRHVFKLPDLGEGTVAAEIVAWRVKPGDIVAEDDVIVEVMTDKAAVEVPSPVSGKVLSTTGNPGDSVPVGSELIVFETQDGGGRATQMAAAADPGPTGQERMAAVGTGASAGRAGAAADGAGAAADGAGAVADGARAVADGARAVADGARAVAGDAGAVADRSAAAAGGAGAGAKLGAAEEARAPARAAQSSNGSAGRVGRVATSPAIRRRAHEAGIDLSRVHGTGPSGRIVREDLDAFVAHLADRDSHQAEPAARSVSEAGAAAGTEEIKVIGVRRLIAQKMSDAKRNIPHFAYVEEIDVTELESLRRHLNNKTPATRAASGAPAARETPAVPLTYLPFLVAALVRVLEEFPQCNATYDADRGVIIRHRAVHVGVATQTPDGLKVPVVRDAQTLSLRDLASEIRRVTEAARTGTAKRDELIGSTITVTSLGKLGGIASTPIINAPEVAIVGVNRAVERPVVVDGVIAIRRMMNLSSSFDHRFVDGHDAAAMIQALKERIEHPATIFIGR